MVIINDTCAYSFGRKFGRTSLIALSPKKTVEGFIGALISTLIGAIILPCILVKSDYLTCPIILVDSEMHNGRLPKLIVNRNCPLNPMFEKKEYKIPIFSNYSVHLMPLQIHSFVLGIFTSIVGPFGGFLASGFKRAFGLKDFGTSIPGHGGILDRFDCVILVSIFFSQYISTFI
ncbi:MAG: phosphatidate cytidylyltransferase, partial [Paramarteilia canceri]